jgi:hypothetical protein
MKIYRLSPAGRRTSIVLLLGALLIWAFAIWSFVSTLRLSLSPDQLWPSLQASLAAGLGVGQVVPALLMLVLIVATPLLIWNLLEEWSATYSAGDDGLRFESLGMMIALPWSVVAGLRPGDDDGDEPLDEIMLRQDAAAQIANPLLRFLHRQAYGSRRLPVYVGLEDRDDLLNDIRSNAAASADA